jgi:hypothetical protein
MNSIKPPRDAGLDNDIGFVARMISRVAMISAGNWIIGTPSSSRDSFNHICRPRRSGCRGTEQVDIAAKRSRLNALLLLK